MSKVKITYRQPVPSDVPIESVEVKCAMVPEDIARLFYSDGSVYLDITADGRCHQISLCDETIVALIQGLQTMRKQAQNKVEV